MRLVGLPARIGVGLLCAMPIAAQVAAPSPPSAAPPTTATGLIDTFGTSDVVYVSIDSEDMGARVSSVVYTFGAGGGQNRYSASTIGEAFSSGLHLPAGAQLISLELDYYDVSATGYALANLKICSRFGGCSLVAAPGGCPSGAYLLCSDGAGAPGVGAAGVDLTANNIFIDPLNFRYTVLTGTTTTNGTTAVGQVMVAYRLRVSPAPPTASFGDVPTSHPFFQFIEALADSGITAGCGGGNFCPDSPLTRGQMAVFLAKALGLHFQ